MQIRHIRALLVGKGGFQLIHPFVPRPRLDKSVMFLSARYCFDLFNYFRLSIVFLFDVHTYLFISVLAVFIYAFSYFTSLSYEIFFKNTKNPDHSPVNDWYGVRGVHRRN